jgi:hypothetical protein
VKVIKCVNMALCDERKKVIYQLFKDVNGLYKFSYILTKHIWRGVAFFGLCLTSSNPVWFVSVHTDDVN